MKRKPTFLIGVIIGILGIVLFSSKAVMVKLAYQYEVDAITVLMLRMLFALPFYIGILLLYKSKNKTQNKAVKPSNRDYLNMFLVGLVGYYLASLFDFIGLTYIKASLERIILFLYPTLVILINTFFFKYKLRTDQIIAIILCYLGIVITFGQEVQISGSQTYLGGFYILLCAITYALYLVGSGRLIPKFGVVVFTSYAMIMACIGVFIHYLCVDSVALFQLPWQVFAYGFLIAMFATVIPSYLVSWSIQVINASNFAIIAGFGPISTIVLATLFLNETLTIIQLLGTLVVILGIVVVTYKSKSKKV